MILVLSPAPGYKINAKLLDGEKIVFSYALNPQAQSAQKKLARACGVTTADLLAWIAELPAYDRKQRENPVEIEKEVPGGSGAPEECKTLARIRVRGLHQFRDTTPHIFEGEDYAELVRNVLKQKFPDLADHEPVLDWEDGKKLIACVDLDYHTFPGIDTEAHRSKLADYACRIEPAPVAWHISHGGGLKLYYTARDGFTAEELGAAGAVWFVRQDGRATVEIKHTSRHPQHARGSQWCGEVHYATNDCKLSALSSWFSKTVDDDTVASYLASLGVKIGDTLPHKYCPINPCESACNPPVYFGNIGVYCHRCKDYGIRHAAGSGAGFISYASLTGRANNVITGMTRNFTHWEHAKIVLAHYLNLSDEILRPAYSAALKMLHPHDPRIKRVFHAGQNMIRTSTDCWQSLDGSFTYDRDIKPILEEFPATMEVHKDEMGDLVVRNSAAKVNHFKLPKNDLSRFGYPVVSLVKGCKIFGQHMPYPDGRIPFVTLDPGLYGGEYARFGPRYVPPYLRNRRIEETRYDPWAVLERVFPGVDRNYVKLCLAAKGCAEGRTSQNTFIFCSGPAKTGKSSTPQIAAMIAGDIATEIQWKRNQDEFRMGIHDALSKGSTVIVDEILKTAEREGIEPRQAMDPLLSLTENSLVRKLHIGNLSLGAKPVVVCTDTKGPGSFAPDDQLGRRIIWVRLSQTKQNWDVNLAKYGIPNPLEFRKVSEEHAEAANYILSEFIDDYFQSSERFEALAEKFGYQMLGKSDENRVSKGDLLELAKLIDAAPKLEGPAAERFEPSAGWKLIQQTVDSPLKLLWDELCDGSQGEKWRSSRRCDETDWQTLLGTATDTVCEYRTYRKNAIVIRIRMGACPRKPLKVSGWGLGPSAILEEAKNFEI